MNEPAGLNIDVELEELEYRLERLRALYEQYFLGIEKLEPTIPRKDVDRRIWMLRREKMRNTGKKFKLQVLVQRYNTFQQYWARICREIENGTYRRHVLKAEKILAETAAPKKKLREPEEGKPQRAGAVQDAESEIAAALASGSDLGGEDLDELLGLRTPTGMRSSVRPSAAPGASRGSSASAGGGRSGAPRSKYELQRLDLNIDDLIGGGAAPIGARPATAAPAARPARPGAAPADAPPASAKAPPAVGPMAGARPRMPKGLVPPAPAPTGPPVSRPHHPPPVPPRDAPPQSVRPARSGGPPPVPSRRPGPPPVPSRAPAAPPPRAEGAPSPPAAARPPPARPAPPPTRPNRPPAAGGGLTDDRVRELHARLTDAKRQVNDGGSVSMDGLARQLRAAEQDLRKRHGNRKIDFDVVIRDGKAVVKPKVK